MEVDTTTHTCDLAKVDGGQVVVVKADGATHACDLAEVDDGEVVLGEVDVTTHAATAQQSASAVYGADATHPGCSRGCRPASAASSSTPCLLPPCHPGVAGSWQERLVRPTQGIRRCPAQLVRVLLGLGLSYPPAIQARYARC